LNEGENSDPSYTIYLSNQTFPGRLEFYITFTFPIYDIILPPRQQSITALCTSEMGKYDSDDDRHRKKNKLGILSHDNSDNWFKRMKLMLVGEGTWFAVEKNFDGGINHDKAEEYDKKSSKAMVVMMNYLSDEDNMATQDCNTAWEMWV
jgi:hypothetical protein